MSVELMTDLIEDMIAMHCQADFQTYLHAFWFNHCNPADMRHLDIEIKKAVSDLLESYTLTDQEYEELFKVYTLQGGKRTGGKMEALVNEFALVRDPRRWCSLRKALEKNSSQRINARAELGYWLWIRERLQPKLTRVQRHSLPKEARRHYGRQWKVVGGASGGLVVRLGEAFESPSLNSRLATGAVVKELNMAGTRLHYEIVSGSGPGYGWVSIRAQGSKLLELLSASSSAGKGGGDGKAKPERRKSGSSARRTETPPCAAGEEDDDRRRAERRKHNVWDPTEAPPPFDDSEDEAGDRTEAEQQKHGAMVRRKVDPDSSRREKKRVSFEDKISEASTAASEASPHSSSSSSSSLHVLLH